MDDNGEFDRLYLAITILITIVALVLCLILYSLG